MQVFILLNEPFKFCDQIYNFQNIGEICLALWYMGEFTNVTGLLPNKT